MDYDAGGYDYRTFWQGRDFEHQTEARLLTRLLTRIGPVECFADLGGGFGRNLPVFRRFARTVVLVDYSMTNLRNAARALYSGDGAGGQGADGTGSRVLLVRADVYRLPFHDQAFDGAACVRLLHHLTDLDAALIELGRVTCGDWLIDVPIRHHMRARLRGAAHRGGTGGRSPVPLSLGTDERPYWNFDLRQVRNRLRELGWRTRVAASVHNVRGWERLVPVPVLCAAASPLARTLELLLQRLGRSWWGPSQFLVARRVGGWVRGPEARDRFQPLDVLACPDCHGRLALTETPGSGGALAECPRCATGYRCEDGIWDFVHAVVPKPVASLPSLRRHP